MQLWNDYEGKTIADKYPLGPLVRPEGRSALFALSAGAEAPAIIRLTESLNDEGQMLACWSRVAEVKQENLVTIKRFGETNFEGTPLTYAVMEPTDANLDDLLKERPLTHSEAMQVATSLVAALSALHAKGLVHEHIDPVNVLAVGETVKLRTDCVRECIVDAEHMTAEDCANLMQRDVHDLSTLLLRALTLEKNLRPAIKLPAPFDRVIPNGMNGTWGLPEIAAILAPPSKPSFAATAPVQPAPAQHAPVQAQAPSLAEPALSHREAAPSVDQQDESVDSPLLYQRRNQTGTATARPKVPVWVPIAVIAIVVIAVILHVVYARPVPAAQSAITHPAAVQPASQVIVRKPTPTSARSAASSSQQLAASNATAAASVQTGWYVVAYTFNHQDQASRRAEAIAKRNPSLHAQVIAPGGRAPYLVALGGPMTRTEAEATRNRARQAGMPRDTFVRNYKGA